MFGKLFLAPQESYATGYRKAAANLPGSVTWSALIPGSRNYLAARFVLPPGGGFTANKISLWVRRRGTPKASLTVELRAHGVNAPGAVLQSATITTSDIPDIISEFYRVTIPPQALTEATNYWIVVYSALGESDHHWQVAVNNAPGNSMESSDATTWIASAVDLYYRITDAGAGYSQKFFQYQYSLYCLMQTSGAPKLYMNGDRGCADSNAGNLTRLIDATTDSTIGGVAVATGPRAAATAVTADTVKDLVRWVTLDELRTKIGCQGAQLKIVNNELPYGYVDSPYQVTIHADGGVPIISGAGKYKWCIQGTTPPGITSTQVCPVASSCTAFGDDSSWLRSDDLPLPNPTPTNPTTYGSYALQYSLENGNDNCASKNVRTHHKPQIKPASRKDAKKGRNGGDACCEVAALRELPFDLPVGWEWVRLGETGHTQTGTTPSKVSGDNFGNFIPFIKPGDLYQSGVDYNNEGLSETGLKNSGRNAPAGSLLMVCIGTIGKCQLIDRDCSFNQQINSVTPYKGVLFKLLTGCMLIRLLSKVCMGCFSTNNNFYLK